MPEQYTIIKNLFNLSNVLNAKLIVTPDIPAPALHYTLYSDGRREIDGCFSISMGSSVAADEAIITMTDKALFGTFTATGTAFQISAFSGGSLLQGGAQYDKTTGSILFRQTTEILSLETSISYYIHGIIVPQEVKELPSLLWGG